MPQIYQNLGVQFAYPENWEISDEQVSQWPRSVVLQPPGTGFWMLQVHEDAEPRELTQHVLKTMREEYPNLEAEPFVEAVGKNEIVGFDMNFDCLDLLVGAHTRGVRIGKLTVLILCQAEDREFDELEQVFHAMLLSLLQHFEQQEKPTESE